MSLLSDEVFDKIRVRLTKIDPNNRKLEFIYAFRITKNGKPVKTWVLDLKNVKLIEGDAPGVECTLICDDQVMSDLGNGRLSAKDAMAQDKLDVEGNIPLALALEGFVASLKE